ncbi:MAG: type II toxin-antitoxin system HipA family toxin [Bdellovibrionales bacterium]|nr:type II toxin-antitoxin system HipA family toxin [Bdellovibrionales bacterium]
MTTLLEVYWGKSLVGQLWLSDDNMQFEYAESWLNNPNALPLSKRLPLQKGSFPSDRVKIFFCNLLPEEELRKRLSKQYGISEDNYFGLLEKIGGECAGALSILPKNFSFSQESSYEELSNQKLNDMIDNRANTPFIISHQSSRMSLAGAQDKLPVFFDNNKVYLPTGWHSSSHILKPPSTIWKNTAINELFCMTLAKKIGLNVPDVSIYNTGKHLCYLIERYDRVRENKELKRVHQEDFCQALGLMPSQKYQKNGGGVNLKNCFNFIEQNSSSPLKDIIQLIKWVIFNIVIGNCDAHAKNLSLLIHDNGDYTLAPFYDILSTTVYPDLNQELAMKVGGDYSLNNTKQHRWKKFAEEIQIQATLIKNTSLEVCNSIKTHTSTITQQIQESWGKSDVINKIQNKAIQRSDAILKSWN